MDTCKFLTIPVLAVLGSALWSADAFAQSDDGSGEGGGVRVPVGGGNTTVVVNPSSATTTSVAPWGMLSNPADAGEGGSYGFDLPGTGSTQTVRGSPQASFTLTGRATGTPSYHTVRRGDTLWDLCDRYFENPYAWPRVWSYNPQIENPHWIYPGDRIRMRAAGAVAERNNPTAATVRQQTSVQQGTLFLRDLGYISDESEDIWGTLVGSPNDQMLLSDRNEAYLKIEKDHDIRIGQELTLFRRDRKPEVGGGDGRIVHVKGTVRVTHWNPDTRIARVRVIESLDVIERGDKVGPVTRRFDVVPPVRNDRDVWAKITGAIQPAELIGQHQVVFVDKGEKDGLRPGNRLFAVANGDRWHNSVRVGRRTAANSVHYQLHSAEISTAPDTVSGQKLPSEVVGELQVLRVREQTAICIVTHADFEMEPGQVLLARRGY